MEGKCQRKYFLFSSTTLMLKPQSGILTCWLCRGVYRGAALGTYLVLREAERVCGLWKPDAPRFHFWVFSHIPKWCVLGQVA